MVKRVVFAVPGSLDTPTGGYAYDRRIMAELRQLGWDVECLTIGEGFPAPDEALRAAALAEVASALDGRTPRKVIVVPGRMVSVVV